MSIKNTIERKLEDAFQPIFLSVVDESHLHKGHAGYRPGGETHFRVKIISPMFSDMDRTQRHRAIYACLKHEMVTSVHSMSVEAHEP